MNNRRRRQQKRFWSAFCVALWMLLPGALFRSSAQADEHGLVTFPAFGSWNGFHNQYVVTECLNLQNSAAHLALTLLGNDGAEIAHEEIHIPPYGTRHTILNDVAARGGHSITNAYGLFRLEKLSDEIPKVTCLTAHYHRLPPTYQTPAYAFALPVKPPLQGTTYGLFNSIDPSVKGRATENWLALSNPSGNPIVLTVEAYRDNGELELSSTRSLRPWERVDLALGHVGNRQISGHYRIIPHNPTAPYDAALVRYNHDGAGNFDFAFALFPSEGAVSESLSASSMGFAFNWLELGNPFDEENQIEVVVRQRDGAETFRQIFTLGPRRLEHLFLNNYIPIPAGGTGNVGSVTVNALGSRPVIAQSMFYGHAGWETNLVRWAYGSQAMGAPKAGQKERLVGSVNTFFHAANWLKLSNFGGNSIAPTLDVFSANGMIASNSIMGVEAFGTLDFGAHDHLNPGGSGWDQVGTVQADLPFASSPVSGELLRVFLGSQNEILSIMPTPLAITDSLDRVNVCLDSVTPLSSSTNLSENTAVNIELPETDRCGEALSYSIQTAPAHGVAQQLDAYHFRYTPAFHYLGPDRLVLTVQQAGGATASLIRDFITVPAVESFAGDENDLRPYRSQLSAQEVQRVLNSVALGGDIQDLGDGLSHSTAEFIERLLNELVPADLVTSLLPTAAEDSSACANAIRNRPIPLTLDEYANEFRHHECFRSLGTSSRDQLENIQDLFLTHLRYGPGIKNWMTTFFWQNHFSTDFRLIENKQTTHKNMKAYWDRLQTHALGRFLPFAEAMLYDHAFISFLDNEENTVSQPNENFGRELLEIYTMGLNSTVNGVTTVNYDENSILPSTLAVTGFRARNVQDEDAEPRAQIEFNIANSKRTPITIFPGTPYERSGVFNYQNYLPYIIHDHPGTARNLGEKLFMAVAGRKPSEQLVDQLAEALHENDFDIKDTLRIILRSSAMFTPPDSSHCIYSPLEVVMRVMRSASIPLRVDGQPNSNGVRRNGTYRILREMLNFTGHSIFMHKDAFGNASCGMLQHGPDTDGSSWLTAQTLLGIDRSIDELLNEVTTVQGYQPNALFPPTLGHNATPTQLLDYVTDLFGVAFSNQQRALLLEYLEHSPDNSNQIVSRPWSGLSANEKNIKAVGLLKIIGTSAEYLQK